MLAATRDFTLEVNASRHTVTADPDTPLLYILRNDLCLNGPKFGCGLGECGACAVLIDGVAARACTIPVRGAAGHAITTLEGLGTPQAPGPVQQAFIDEQAAQCGYCLNGMIIATQALLLRNAAPTDEEIRHELQYHLCCGTHIEIMAAVRRAARLWAARQA
ncbi:(2Fe-2S)-binding protein [Bordetella pertussis]|uniref:(2Fe-2S)-binding protein n=1 Tax=Bordetella pertussis TaxID=520 RepID=UPI0005E34810|nr:(2Fe-2S)-binding protein [Bordetella pertussis]CPL93512.1 oxidoreductase [Bordetella pertussis]